MAKSSVCDCQWACILCALHPPQMGGIAEALGNEASWQRVDLLEFWQSSPAVASYLHCGVEHLWSVQACPPRSPQKSAALQQMSSTQLLWQFFALSLWIWWQQPSLDSAQKIIGETVGGCKWKTVLKDAPQNSLHLPELAALSPQWGSWSVVCLSAPLLCRAVCPQHLLQGLCLHG